MTKKFYYALIMAAACGGDPAKSEPIDRDDDDATEERRDARADEVRDAARADAAALRDAARDSAAPAASDASALCPSESRAPAELHRAALEILTPATPCALASCHGTRGKVAGLVLSGVTDLRSVLVEKEACEAPNLPLVDGSGGASALENSWLWLKLTSDVDADGVLAPSARYGTAKSCGQSGDEPYGLLMPLASEPLEEDRLAPIRAWICAGAPGP